MVLNAEGAEAPSAERMLAEALEANRQLSELADGLIEDNALLREQVARLAERDAERDAGLERLRADFAVLQRMLFGRSSEKSRPGPPTGRGLPPSHFAPGDSDRKGPHLGNGQSATVTAVTALCSRSYDEPSDSSV